MKTRLRRIEFSDAQSLWEVIDAHTEELLYTIKIDIIEGHY